MPGHSLAAGFVATLLVAALPALAADRIPLDGATAEVCFTPGSDCARAIAGVIGEARKRVWLLGYGFTSRPVLAALIAAERRGVDGYSITRMRPGPIPVLLRLRRLASRSVSTGRSA